MVSIDYIPSIINNSPEVFDLEKPFTFIEFIKLFEYSKEQDAEYFDAFTRYLHAWAEHKNSNENADLQTFVQGQLFDLLKTITLSYTSYEEQRYLANIKLDNDNLDAVKAVVPIFSKRILDICNFYRKKRQGVRGIIRRNSFKGSVQSIEEVVYNKIVDWVFSNKNIPIAYKEIRNNLNVSIENFVDTYSEYFDIPRDKEVQDKVRYNYDMLTSNMNTVDYRYFVSVSEVVSGMLYQGKVYLKEIPLIAQLALDLGQQCVGDLLAMKNSLSYKATINRIDLDEQIVIKRDLYKKFIGCDLYYAYMDQDRNIITDILCKADNPTGNLLNCCSADAAVQPSYQLKELAKIGLFFKPDKCSILKVNARDYTWSFDTDNMTEGSWYIFPDPNKYGDIGNNKSADYPLVMTYKDTYDIRNLSSGEARDYPLVFLGDQNWRAYYSKSDDEFIQFDNGKFDYQFTKKIIGFSEDGNYSYPLQNYQMDMYGNQFALLSIETDMGEQTITFFDLDRVTNDTTISYITRVKVEISDQLKRMGGAVLTITRGEEVVSFKLKNKKSYISFDCAFGEEYTYNINIRLGNKSILAEEQTHKRELPTESTKVTVEYKPAYYTLSTEFTHSFENDDISKERYESVIPEYKFKKAGGFFSDAISKEKFEEKKFEYDTKYVFDVYTYFECSCTSPDYVEAFSDYKTIDKVDNDIFINVTRLNFSIASQVKYDYMMNIDYHHEDEPVETIYMSAIDGKYPYEITIKDAELHEELITESEE